MPQFQQPAFDPQQFQQFLQWQQVQKTSQMQQPQFQQTQEDLVESPSKAKPKKNKNPSKMVTEKNDKQPTKTSRQKWPNSDEMLFAQGVISISEDPILGNNQNGDAYWGKVEKYNNESEHLIPQDINVLNQSPVFNQFLKGNAPQCNFIVNGNEYTQRYHLADGIYPEWSTLVKSFVYPPINNLKMQYIKRRQESCRKDVERAFGVLQARWAMIRGPGRSTSILVLGDIMHACIILHNMIVEDEGHMITDWSREEYEPEPPSYNGGAPTEFAQYLQRFRSLRSKDTHIALHNDLMEHLWNLTQANQANKE